MCELLGLNFNEPVRCGFSFRGFRHRSESNPHGWGIGRYDGKDAVFHKEPMKSSTSKLSKAVENDASFTSNIFIGHVRNRSGTDISFFNTHPFSQKFRGHDFMLAHNGTLDKNKISSNLDFKPKGKTDSELFMCALLFDIQHQGLGFSDFEKIRGMLHQYNKFGTMCLLFSEGEHLFAYRDIKGERYLSFTERQSPYGEVSLEDEDWQVNLNEEKSPSEKGIVIATKNLTKEEGWKEFGNGELKVFKNGEIVFSN
jgi:predicted glutamine amidotransferase